MSGAVAHEKAKAKADRIDKTFFLRTGTRTHYIRRSLPFEIEGWGPTDHERQPLVVVSWRGGENGRWFRLPFSTQKEPDGDEVTAIAIFNLIVEAGKKVDPTAPPTTLRPSAEECRAAQIVAMSAVTTAKHPDIDPQDALEAAAQIYDRRHPKRQEAHLG